MKIKKGDTVIIQKGKDKGKSGKVIRVFPNESKIVVENLNLFKKHTKPKRQGEKGEVVSIARPMQSANAALFCSNCGKGVRVSYEMKGDQKMRRCKKCGSSF